MERIKIIDKWFPSVSREQRICFGTLFAFLGTFGDFLSPKFSLKGTVTDFDSSPKSKF